MRKQSKSQSEKSTTCPARSPKSPSSRSPTRNRWTADHRHPRSSYPPRHTESPCSTNYTFPRPNTSANWLRFMPFNAFHCPVSAESKKCARCIDRTESAAKTPAPPTYQQLFFPISTLPFRSQSPYPDPRQTTHPTPPKSCRARLSLRFVLFLESSLLSAVATSQS